MSCVDLHIEEVKLAAEAASDPTELKRLLDLLGFWASYSAFESAKYHERLMIDSLTGVFSEDAYKERMEPELLRYFDPTADRRKHPAGYVVIKADMDGLRLVNNTLGHAEGDRRLQHCAHVLANSVRQTDWVSRSGDRADEFWIVLRIDADSDPRYVFNQVSQRIEQASKTTEFEISISIGSAYSEEYYDLASLLDAADFAMYESKRSKEKSSDI